LRDVVGVVDGGRELVLGREAVGRVDDGEVEVACEVAAEELFAAEAAEAVSACFRRWSAKGD
jgi:hypothetical protein